MGKAPWSWRYKEDPGWGMDTLQRGEPGSPSLSYLAECSLQEEGCVLAAAVRTRSEAPKCEC